MIPTHVFVSENERDKMINRFIESYIMRGKYTYDTICININLKRR